MHGYSSSERRALIDAGDRGMAVAWHAARRPDEMAVASRFGSRTFAELNARANQLAHRLREAGLHSNDAIAIVMRNRPEFIEAMCAAYRIGLRFTPINFHLQGDEIGYIVDNCEAKAFIADATLGGPPIEALASAPGASLRLSVGGPLAGFDALDDWLAGVPETDVADPELGNRMLYTSGTTGRPKGVYRREAIAEPPQWEDVAPAGYRAAGDRNLCTGPAYHAAPLAIDINRPLNAGAGIVMMDKWDAEETLALIEQHRITHCHMVATMFHRLLALPDDVRNRYDISSLRYVVHGAAPCPVHVKRAMIDWFGPIIWEYYAATEGGGGFLIGSEEWLTKPGTVGRPGPEFDNRILDDDGNEVGANVVGTIYMRAPERGQFEYFNDSEKTGKSYRDGYFTLGDMGYFDADGYLFLTGRSAELIISGGVNIYPQEVDSAIQSHPAVLDLCTVGVPNDEWGEEVLTVVQIHPGHVADDALAAELISWARERLAHFKCPRRVLFADDLPRLPSGKIQRRHVRDAYRDT
ncbi:MAG: AMP-binding protein [Pseudomonadota bacterium]